MRGSKKMHEEEIITMSTRLNGIYQDGDGCFLRVAELLVGIGDFPGVPVFEDQVFVFGEEDVDVVVSLA